MRLNRVNGFGLLLLVLFAVSYSLDEIRDTSDLAGRVRLFLCDGYSLYEGSVQTRTS